ncbi:Protein of uncharacterised function VcgC/VcgE (DUF2780) [Vibrio cholerae]|nr:Protein of uncharacterised function VcgC/VcgE (DUF2780) [Vibrio cholerae]
MTQFTSQFPLSPQQAGGGVATLLAQAQNNLNADQKSELLQLIPNLNDLNGLIPNQNLSTILQRKEVNQAFNTLGLDASMVEQSNAMPTIDIQCEIEIQCEKAQHPLFTPR